MTVQQYLCIVVCLVGLGLYTVADHVERVRVGYEIRRLEHEQRRLKEELKTRRLMWERRAAAETVAQRAVALKVLEETQVRDLQLDQDNSD